MMVRFFQSLWPKGPKLAQAELHNRGKSNQTFIEGKWRLRTSLAGLDMASEEILVKADSGIEMFYCPTPMREGSGRKKYQVEPSTTVFSDADYGLSREAHARLVSLGAGLNLSGGKTEEGRPKYHIYLRLSRPVGLDDLEKINRGLKAFVNGDKFDATSLLRIPGTRNHKYPGSPIVTVERYADQTHDPEFLMEEFPVPKDVIEGVALEGMKLPQVPDGFRFTENKPGYFKVRRVVREWNGRFQDTTQNIHRYAAAIAIVKETIKAGLSVDVAYAFAEHCAPLVDKQAEENGYSIQKDIARTYYRETKVQSSGMTVEDFTREATAGDAPVPSEPVTSTTPAELASLVDLRDNDDDAVTVDLPKSMQHQGEGPNPYSARDNRRYTNMAILTAGGFKPVEPELFSIAGEFCILYPGMTHSIFGDSGSGKTWIVLAQVAEELKAGRRVKYIDFENGTMTIGNRLHNVLGVPVELLTPDRFRYMAFNDKPDGAEIDEETAEGYDLVIIDGVDASLAMWDVDPNKATEIRKWYNDFPQKFSDEGATVLMIDHTTKKSSQDTPPKAQQPGGAGTKLAVLTGAAFYVHPKDGYELIPGRRGIVEAYITRKDKDGFLKSKAQKNGHLFNFIIDTLEDGSTWVGFEAAKDESPGGGRVNLSDEDRSILEVLDESSGPMNIAAIKGKFTGTTLGKRGQEISNLVSNLVGRGYIQQTQNGRSKDNSITSLGRDALAGRVTLDSPSSTPGGESRGDNPRSSKGEAKRECRNCREKVVYPRDFVKADEEGYQYGRPLCYPCAREGITSESEIPRDGSEWARKKREDIERDNPSRGRRKRS